MGKNNDRIFPYYDYKGECSKCAVIILGRSKTQIPESWPRLRSRRRIHHRLSGHSPPKPLLFLRANCPESCWKPPNNMFMKKLWIGRQKISIGKLGAVPWGIIPKVNRSHNPRLFRPFLTIARLSVVNKFPLLPKKMIHSSHFIGNAKSRGGEYNGQRTTQ